MKDKPNFDPPQGFAWHFNETTDTWSFRPEVGFSDKFLTEESFIPQKETNDLNVSDESKNKFLHKAKNKKDDEFYTRIEDIIDELKHYDESFRGKTIYCPCDKVFNLGRSEFFNYFAKRFFSLGIKKIICTQYNPNGRGVLTEVLKNGIKWEYNGELGDNATGIDESDIDTFILDGDGSFDSEECIEIMKQSDIVVTNPPFSLFRKFLDQIIDLGKQFIIIGNKNALTYKEVYHYFQENRVWLGYTSPKDFKQPKGNNKKPLAGLTRWFTNIPHDKRKEELYFSPKYKYSPEKYPTYNNYNAINIEKVKEIPFDYYGVMGVPISFLDKYNPNQFKIIGFRKGNDGKDLEINGRTPYFRVLVQRIK